MVKNYVLLLFITLFSFQSNNAFGQLVANPDYGEIASTANSAQLISNVLANDTVNGVPATLANVTINQITNQDPSVSVESNGSAWYTPVALTNAQTHIIYYRIIEIADPDNWAIAAVTLNVGGCLTTAPEITGIVLPTCNTPGSVTLNNLPSGNWTLAVWQYGSEYSQISGSGATYTVSGLYSNIYHFSVSQGNFCRSLPIFTQLFSDCYLHFDYTGNYADFNSDGMVTPGDVVNFQFAFQNNSDIDYTVVGLTAYDSTMVLTGDVIPSLAAGESNNTAYTGMHVITQTDINNGYISDRVDGLATQSLVPLYFWDHAYYSLGITDGIKLSAFADNNANGIQDNNETNFSAGSFQFETNNDGNIHHIATPNGSYYLYENNPANTYNLSFEVDNGDAFSSSSISFSNISIANGSGILAYNFPITVIPHNNLAVYLSPNVGPRPGSICKNTITYKNLGTNPISGTLTFTKDPLLNITNISIPGTVATPEGFTYNLTGLQPNHTASFTISMLVPTIPTVALGQQLTNSVSISIPDSDTNAADNNASLTQTIFGSYDPNNKSENHGGKIDPAQFGSDEYLTYTIHFENTGNANAINVKLADVLDEKLDEASVRMVGSSHDYSLDRIGNSLEWNFAAINLPPSVADSDTGKGFVSFQVKPKPGYAVGDIIPNTANIFFDFNPAITTNTFETEFVNTLNMKDFADNGLTAYPNPTKDIFNIISKNSSELINSVNVIDVLGKSVLSKTIGNSKAAIDFSSLSKGIYFVKLQISNNQKTIKVIKS